VSRRERSTPPNRASRLPGASPRLRGLLDAIPDALVVVDDDGRIVLVNAQAEALFGYARGELLGQPVELLVPERFREAHAAHRATYATRPRLRPMGTALELVARRRDGSELRVEIGLSPLQTPADFLVVSVIRDVTERVRMEAELRQHRDRLEELVARHTAELTASNRELQREIAERRLVEDELRKQASLLARERQEILTLNQSLESKERFVRNVVESLRDGIAILDLDRRIVGWNRALAQHSGIPLDEIPGQRFFDTFPNFKREGLEPYFDRLYAGDEDAFTLERFEHVSRVTGPMTVNLQGSVIRGPHGRIEGIVLVLENITERVALERTVQQSEKLAAVGTLAASLAHEINNPIGIMISRIELMLGEVEELGLPGPLQEDLRVLQRNAHRVSRITQGLLTFARRAPGVKVAIDLNAVVDDTLVLFEGQAAKAGIRVTRRLAPNLPLVRGEANELQQVLLNLLKNAREAVRDAGEIRVETGSLPDRPGWVRMAVADSGPGIPAEIRAKIFVPFFTTKEDGTGLGLAVSYRIIEDHGGTLDVASAPGSGTTFTVLLPTLDPAATSSA